MDLSPFSVARLPRIEFGDGAIAKLPALAARYGRRALLVTGARSLTGMPQWQTLQQGLAQQEVAYERVEVSEEPSPQLIDRLVQQWHGAGIDVVIGIGGGSVLDAAKALAGLLPHGNSVMDHLEGVGPELPYAGPALPFIAAPTTAGTGSEATKNAVLSVQGVDGFKKSFRDEQLVPQYAVVDPEMLAACPPPLIAANGMDAFTQLLESYVSSRSNPWTDALARSGLEACRDGLLAWYAGGAGVEQARRHMAYAALLSGITLAQTGLGSVHGLASPLGAFFPIPHGVVCGTLVASATACNIQALEAREPAHPALQKYSRVATWLCRRSFNDSPSAWRALVELLEQWTRHMDLPRLSHYGVQESDIPRITAHSRGSSMRTNPIVLTDGEIDDIVRARL